MSILYPKVRGVRAIALSFALLAPQTILVALRGVIPDLWSVVVANVFWMSSEIAMYQAIISFTRGRSRTVWLWAVSFVTLSIVYFYCEVRHEIVPRILVLGVAGVVYYLFMAVALLKGAQRSTQRTHLRLFAGVMMLLALAFLHRTVMTWRYGAPADALARDPLQTPSLVATLVLTTVVGVFFVILFSHDVLLNTRREAHQDPLSLTFNRRGLEVMLQTETASAAISGSPLSVVLADIDHFKHINDLGGHAAGDEAIRRVAAMISNRLRGDGHVGRFGGDEFLLILPHTAQAEAVALIESISAEIARDAGLHLGLPMDGAITLSAGVTQALPGEPAADLLSRADLALYQAKSDGRNCCRAISGDGFSAEAATSAGASRSAA